MLFINFSRCRSFDSADFVRNNANDKTHLIRECENSIKNISARLIVNRIPSISNVVSRLRKVN